MEKSLVMDDLKNYILQYSLEKNLLIDDLKNYILQYSLFGSIFSSLDFSFEVKADDRVHFSNFQSLIRREEFTYR